MMDHNNDDNQNPKPKGWRFNFFGKTPSTPATDENNLSSDSFVETGKSFPLAMAGVGERLRIAKLKGTESTVYRLISMGLVPGTEVQIINIANGSVIVAIGDNRIGLGAGMAQKIMCINI
jgi:ferrous iron transport protein A